MGAGQAIRGHAAGVARLLGRWLSAGRSAVSVNLGGRQFVDLRPVKRPRGGSALNKAGRLVLRGMSAGRAIKIFEAANIEHARFIEAVCRHQLLEDCFPSVQGLHGRFVRVGWITNTAKRAPGLEVLARLLLRFHQTPAAELPEAGFDYWHDLIKPRFSRAAQLLGADELARKVITEVGQAWEQPPQVLLHPDLTPVNVVLSPKKSWQVIDNELLTIGGLPLLDLCNTAHALGPQDGQTFAALYLAGSRVPVTQQNIRILAGAWLARMVGANFVAGDLWVAQQMLTRYRSGHSILPVKIVPSDSISADA